LNQLLFIETFVLGSATIAAIYHLVLFIQQRDKFLIYYSLYLFSLAAYISFKLISNNYSPFVPTTNIWHYVLEEVLQVTMTVVYVLFAAQTLEVVAKKSIVRTLMYTFFILAFVSIFYHLFKAIAYGPGVQLASEYALSRISLVGIATVALLFAWRIRTTTFQRTIIIGSLVYDSSGLMSIISFVTESDIMGLEGVEPYLIGCVLDIIIFSSALGYRLKKIADEKNELLLKEIDSRLAIENTRNRIAINLHDDIGSVLSSMSVYSEAARVSMIDKNLPRALDLVERIGINARETMSSMSHIVWTINPINDNGIKLFNKMEDFATPLFHSMDVEFIWFVDEALHNAEFNMTVRQNLFLIFKEIINNCAKHSGAAVVNVSFIKSGNELIMEISDNGKGFDTEKNHEGNGVSSMRKRAADIDGLFILSSGNDGSVATLSFLLSSN